MINSFVVALKNEINVRTANEKAKSESVLGQYQCKHIECPGEGNVL